VLLNSPLWQGSAPLTWQKQWTLFARQILELDASFSIWLQWFEARIAGKPIELPLLEQWLSLPPEIESQPPAAINQYLASLGSAKQPLNQVRTIFIGYGDAGKTSLIRTLHGEPVVEGKEVMTPGIQIREWPDAGNDIITHFWDFGGQVMAHATHQFFLRASCLYVVVLSARAEINATEQAEYWLQHVQAFGGNATVMIVGNKHDQTPVHLDMASLQAKYPNVLGFYPISCTQALTPGAYQHQFNAFRAVFCQQLTKLGTHQVMFTDAQFKVLTELRRRAAQQAFLQHTEFNTLCQQHRIGLDGGQTQEYFLDLLDKLGVVIHFKDLPYLSEHVLNPRWLTYGVYTVMYASRARLSLREIVTLLSSAVVRDEQGQELSYPPEKCHFIATAMRYFKLCYYLPHDANRIIIPGLLETDQPQGLKQANFDKPRALAYKIAFTGFVPRHVMSEIIVERNEEIENELVWQYGVLLRHRELKARAWVQVDYQARELTIWAEGNDARDYLGFLRDVLKGILSRLTMKYEELIRLPDNARLGPPLPMEADEDWAGYQQIESCLKDGDITFNSVRGLKYDLPKVAKLYVKNQGKQGGRDTYNFYGEQFKLIQAGDNMAGDQIINNSGTINGPVVNADRMENSFNTTNHNANPELTALLQQLLAEIQTLNAKVPAAQVAEIAEFAQELVTENHNGASLDGMIEAAEKLGQISQPVLALAEQVKTLLGL
jgi:C-terminal of Roc, COR, domain/Ras of Complex, Roc, domain of DAPkinase